MRTIEKWMLIELTKPTIIGELYGDIEYYDGYSLQIEFKDIKKEEFSTGDEFYILYTPNGRFMLGEPDKTWWKTRSFT